MENTKDKATDLQIDNLLRKHLKDNPQNVECEGFDPDLASAYAEKTLSTAILENYQNHLIACQNCRQMTTQYLLMFGEEVAIKDPEQVVFANEIVKKEVKKPSTSGWASLREWLFAPQIRWVMAALVIVCTMVWVVYDRNVNTNTVAENNNIKNGQKTTPENINDPKVNDPKLEDKTTLPNNVLATDNKKDLVTAPEKNKDSKDNTQDITPENKVENKEEFANKNAPTVKLPDLKQEGTIPDLAENNKNTPINITDPLQVPPPPPPANSDIAQNTEKNTGNVTTNNNPRSTKGEKLGIGLASDIEEQKNIAGKKFVLKNGVWTDKEYLSRGAKNLKKVELKNGSEEYKKVLRENASLKPYFGIGKSVIVLYNDTLYLIK